MRDALRTRAPRVPTRAGAGVRARGREAKRRHSAHEARAAAGAARRGRVIQDLFPPGVCVAIGRERATDEPLHPDEAELARAMGPARRREFAAGRACARRAMRELGVPDGPVLRGLRRAPLFPHGVVGSITHTNGFCAAAVARSRRSRASASTPSATRRSPSAPPRGSARRASSPRCARCPGRSPERWAAIVFSAKETLYKAYFPLTGFFIGFRDARSRCLPRPTTPGRFEARLLRRDAPDAAGQRRFAGRYAMRRRRAWSTGLVIPHRY